MPFYINLSSLSSRLSTLMPTIFNIFKNVLVKELKVSEEFIFLVEKGGGVVILVLPFVFFVCNNITNQICTV